MQYSAARAGLAFVLRLEDGDILEVILIELTGTTATRRLDPSTGFHFLCP